MEIEKWVLVTGANGYLGTYICKELLRNDYHVIGFVHEHLASRIIHDERIRYIPCDISKEVHPQVREAISGKTILAVVNAAALLGSSDYQRNYDVNAAGVKNMIRFAEQIGVTRFIHISSVVVIKEFKGPYGETKLIGQRFLESSGLEYTVFIPAMILGPESLGLNRILANMFRFPLVVPIIGSGKQTQNPVFVEDFAWAIVRSIGERKSFRKTYQISGDEVISFRDLVRKILKLKKRKKVMVPVPVALARLLGKVFQRVQKVPLFTAEHVKGILQDSRLDNQEIKEDLQFKPCPLDESLGHSLKVIGNDWSHYLSARTEEVLKLDE